MSEAHGPAGESEAHDDLARPSAQGDDEALDAALDELDMGGSEVRPAPVRGAADPTTDGLEDAGLGAEGPSGQLRLLPSLREGFADLGDIPVTGEARVDAATARLDELAGLPTGDHVAVYEDVHRRLHDALSDADPR